MLFLREKNKGVILLIIGFYFFFINPLLSILFERVIVPCIPNPYGPDCDPLDPITYLQLWFMQHGSYILLIALVGLALIIIGRRYFIKKKEMKNYEITK